MERLPTELKLAIFFGLEDDFKSACALSSTCRSLRNFYNAIEGELLCRPLRKTVPPHLFAHTIAVAAAPHYLEQPTTRIAFFKDVNQVFEIRSKIEQIQGLGPKYIEPSLKFIIKRCIEVSKQTPEFLQAMNNYYAFPGKYGYRVDRRGLPVASPCNSQPVYWDMAAFTALLMAESLVAGLSSPKATTSVPSGKKASLDASMSTKPSKSGSATLLNSWTMTVAPFRERSSPKTATRTSSLLSTRTKMDSTIK